MLRGDFRQSQYGRVNLPFALLRRLECVLESSKSAVLIEAAKVEKMAIAEEAKEKLILRATGGLSFFNTPPMVASLPKARTTLLANTSPRVTSCVSPPRWCSWKATRYIVNVPGWKQPAIKS